MKALFGRRTLYEAVRTVAGACAQRSPRPVLQCVLFEVSGKKALLSATNLDVFIRVEVEVREGGKEGRGLVQGGKMAALLREEGADEVGVEIGTEKAVIRAGKARFTLLGADADEFPSLPTFPAGAIEVERAELSRAIGRTVFAAAQEQTRYAINGVCATAAGGKMEFAATDGRRLAVATFPLAAGGDMDARIFPTKMLTEIAGAGEGKRVEVAQDAGIVFARAGRLTVGGRAIEGEFPNYREMIPAKAENAVKVPARELLAGLRQAAQFTSLDSRAVVFKLSRERLVLEVASAELGEARIELGADYGGPDMSIAFNPQFLIDVLGEFGEERVSIELQAPDRPAVIRREGFSYVLAPIRVRGES